MRKILDIYEEYKIMPNLQRHQLRVASVAKQICESIEIPVDTESVIKAALLHDMGNIIKYRFDHAKEIFGFTDEEIDHAKELQKEFREKYGLDDHEANLQIAKEIGVDQQIIDCIHSVGFSHWGSTMKTGTIEEKICAYADTRVSPQGIVSIEDRLIEGAQRYKDNNAGHSFEEINYLRQSMRDIEIQIFENSKIKPEDVNNETVAKYIEELKNYEI